MPKPKITFKRTLWTDAAVFIAALFLLEVVFHPVKIPLDRLIEQYRQLEARK